ncbi:hypothetical protein HPB49_003219 [Dermacentor silvarum]|uniref:Uncharacterized protein n=1 Tax=Dermacentor silvarum TaxID=543639 RepID=A0ACB8C0G0_DERSI|nr:hypothetical protein HPB49_003219 [Dermacentor silvarum]
MAAMANGQSNNKAGANRVYFALKDDVAMLTEVQTSDPFRHSEQWEEIAWRLRDVLKKPFTARCVRERLNLLLSRHLANDRRNQKKSGTEEEYTERDQLLQDILSLIQGTSYKVRSAKKSRKVCSGDSNVQARKSAAAARDVHASRYAERSTVFIDECDTADDEFDIASPTGDVTPAQLLTRMVTADDDDGEREDDISESAMSIDRPVSTEPQSAAATHAVPNSGDTVCAATLATAGHRSTEPPRDADNVLHAAAVSATEEPPAYQVERISVPVALLSSEGDTFAAPGDASALAETLGSRLLFSNVVQQDDFRHLDFFFALAVANAQRRRFNFSFQPPPPRHRFSVDASGGGRNHRNFNVGGSVRGEYDVYRGRDGTRVVASGGVSHGATRIDGKTYKGRPQGAVGIGVEIPIGKGR